MTLNLRTLAILFVLVSHCSFADIAVVVHPSNSATIDSSAVSLLFLGKLKSFPGGSQAIPITQIETNSVATEFNKKVLRKSSSQLKAYWSKLVFTGKGTPPRSMTNDSEVISLISTNPNLIGYVDASAVDDRVKVVATF